MAIQASVTLEAVCDHRPDEVVAFTTALSAAASELDTARLVMVRAVVTGEDSRSEELGAGEAVELRRLLRGEPLVGEGSGAGKSRGCWRVETILHKLQCGEVVWCVCDGKQGVLESQCV